MRRYIPLFFFVALIGCEKSDKTEPAADQPLYEVTFNIDGLVQQTIDKSGSNLKTASTKQPTIASAPWEGRTLVRFEYFVYNTDNKLVKRGVGAYQAGPVRDSLPAGDYYIDFVGHDGAYYYHMWDIEDRRTTYARPGYPPIGYFPTVYHKLLKVNLTENINLGTVTLERVTGNIAVRLSDADIDMPDSLAVWAAVTSVNGFYLADNTPHEKELIYKERIGIRGSYPIRYCAKTFDLPVFVYRNRDNTLKSTVHIWATTPSGDTIASKTIKNIAVKPNKKIILKGYLLRGEHSLIPLIHALPGTDDDIPGYPKPPQGDLNYLDGKVDANPHYNETETIYF